MSAIHPETFLTEDTLAWATFAWGHIDLGLVTSEGTFEHFVASLQLAMDVDEADAREMLLASPPQHLWIYDGHAYDQTGDPDFPWRFCDAEHPAAQGITGWRFTR